MVKIISLLLIILVAYIVIKIIDKKRVGYIMKPNGRFVELFVPRPTRKEVVKNFLKNFKFVFKIK